MIRFLTSRLTRANNIADLRRLARRALPRPIFDYIDGGADDEVTLARNSGAFADYGLIPDVLTDVSRIRTATTLFGQPVAWPLMLSPTGLTPRNSPPPPHIHFITRPLPQASRDRETACSRLPAEDFSMDRFNHGANLNRDTAALCHGRAADDRARADGTDTRNGRRKFEGGATSWQEWGDLHGRLEADVEKYKKLVTASASFFAVKQAVG